MKLSDEVFSDCDFLKRVEIPEGVTSTGGDVFSMCGNLHTVTMPDSVAHIGSNVIEFDLHAVILFGSSFFRSVVS